MPFFDDRHRGLAAELEEWVREHVPDEEPEDACAASRELVQRLGEDGWLELAVPAPHGGRNEVLDVRSLCIAREALAYRSAIADFAFAMQGLGCGPISLFGSDEQKAMHLPGVARGEVIPAFALSEAEAGSDVGAISTTAREEGGGFIIDGEKTWISNAGIADLYVVFARTGGEGSRGLSAFIVDADAPGCTVVDRVHLLSPHPIGTVRFEGCTVRRSALLGRPGQGFAIAMGTLDIFRSTVGAAAVGMARRALDEAVAHVRSRRLFGGMLADLQITQDRLATMAMDLDAATLLVYRAAWTKDAGADRVTGEAAMAKAFATEAAQRIVDASLQLFGGTGVTSGHILERLYRDIRPLRIYEGATEVQHVIIARQILKESQPPKNHA